jgi:DNA repair exonuclease SbcCD ATPase subunit
VVFENASAELEMWNKAASAQVDSQLRERRRAFRRRREALERIQGAASELEQRIGELESQDKRLQGYLTRTVELCYALCAHAETAGSAGGSAAPGLDLSLDTAPAPLRHATA